MRTASADLGLVLYSAYVGHDALDRARVAEVVELDAGEPSLSSREIEVPAGAFTYGRRFALYEHLHRLQEIVGEHGGAQLSAAGVERAMRVLDSAAV